VDGPVKSGFGRPVYSGGGARALCSGVFYPNSNSVDFMFLQLNPLYLTMIHLV
jgi:hypothetical protein